MPPNPNRRRCTATTRAGAPCRAWAIRAPSPDGPNPPLCASHAKLTTGAGAPPGNQNRRTHGAYAQFDPPPIAYVTPEDCPPAELAQVVQDLMTQYVRLSRLIDYCLQHLDGHTLEDALKLMALHAQTASRLGRLLQIAPDDEHTAFDSIEDADAETLIYQQMQIAARLMELDVLPGLMSPQEEQDDNP